MIDLKAQTKWDLRFLDLAGLVSTWSKDPSTKVGAVITDSKNRIVSLGYNGLPAGITDHDKRLQHRETKLLMIVHAERNAMLFANRDLTGCTLYTFPFCPCSQCAAMIIQTGISRVVFPSGKCARWDDDFTLAKSMFEEAGIEVSELGVPINLED